MVMLSSSPLLLPMEMLSGRPQQSVTSSARTADPVRGRDRITLVDLTSTATGSDRQKKALVPCSHHTGRCH
jgi:hypothetical protein